MGECVSESLAKGGDSFLELRIAAYRCVASSSKAVVRRRGGDEPQALALVTDPAYEHAARPPLAPRGCVGHACGGARAERRGRERQ